MSPPTLLPNPELVCLNYAVGADDVITLVATTIQAEVRCPECGRETDHLHSQYVRTVADLPWRGIPLRLTLHTRRFYCDAPECLRKIFTERLGTLAAPYARRTRRLAAALDRIAYTVGGAPGASLTDSLGMAVSAATLVRQVCAQAPSPTAAPRVLGVDDWAMRKGQRYGTLLVDLEAGEPVDLLPDRKAETLAAWLKEHPGAQIITRDRGGAYKEGAQQGAPDALQVADRWHLLQNLREALEGTVARAGVALAAAACPQAAEPTAAAPDTAAPRAPEEPVAAVSPPPPPPPKTRAEQERAVRRARRAAVYEEVHRLYAEGYNSRAIAYKTGKARQTVRTYLAAQTFPERKQRAATPRRPSKLAGYEAYLLRRWQEGCHNANQLWRELRARGFEGSCATVKERVEAWRKKLSPQERRVCAETVDQARESGVPAPRTVSYWLLGSPEKRTAEQAAFLERLKQERPEIAVAQSLALEFVAMTQRREGQQLEGWTQRVVASGIEELKRFGAGLVRDWEAVVAGLTLPWSNGPVEGQVNRLKLVKRQMYGRGGFALLRARVLPRRKTA